MKRIVKILLSLFAWVVGVSIIGTSGISFAVGLRRALEGMPLLFIADASYMLVAFLSSILTGLLVWWVLRK